MQSYTVEKVTTCGGLEFEEKKKYVAHDQQAGINTASKYFAAFDHFFKTALNMQQSF